MSQEVIAIRGARVHNLKNIDVDIPKNQLVVITGLSGSGKSSLAFDTLYAEGQRRYVESLSSYARQFLGRLDKPDCDGISGLSPAIAIEQKVASRNPRSTVGTVTEVYDYMKLLFARVGKTYSPISGEEVKRHTVSDVIHHINHLPHGHRLLVLAPIKIQSPFEKTLELLQSQGFARVFINEEVATIADLLKNPVQAPTECLLVIDRLVADQLVDDALSRAADSIQTAFYEGEGSCIIMDFENGTRKEFSDRFELDGITFDPPSTHLFSFNNPYGACPKCEGFGSIIGIDEDLVIPQPHLSVYEDCVASWKGEQMKEWKHDFILNSAAFNFPIHRPYDELSDEERKLLWNGKGRLKGIRSFFDYLESKSYKIQYRVMLARYRGKTKCTVCEGGRLRPEAAHVKIQGKSIQELNEMPIDQLADFFQSLQWENAEQAKIADRLLIEINNRLNYLLKVGLPYLHLNRQAATLSGGESQRVHLATSLGSSLVGSIYLLDEPSIGLHPRDTEKLIEVLEELRDLGNTVVVVEHDEDIMRKADYLIDIGPEAGVNGGQKVFAGKWAELKNALKQSHTARYLLGQSPPLARTVLRKPTGFIRIEGAKENNLKGIDVDFPLGVLTAVTGVSGSGKSTLIKRILYPALKRELEGQGDRPGKFKKMVADLNKLHRVEFVDQNPIGRSSRSNPVTYLKAYDDIRSLFADQTISQQRGYKTKHFSFNVAGGRCDKCEGEGKVTIEMQFMADVHVVCEECHSKKFKQEILEVKFQGKNIYDVLEMTVEEAVSFFQENGKDRIAAQIQPLMDVGLGYVSLGQSSSTLSGGEAQRIKLASFLLKGKESEPTLFIFDEPTTGLHFHDVAKLLQSFDALLEKGHSILVIEHQMDIVRAADWIIDLGPEGGRNGGKLLYAGPLSGIQQSEESITKNFLADQKNI